MGRPNKLRKTFSIAGFSPKIEYEVYQNNLDAVERALKERVFYVSYNGKFEPAPRPDLVHFTTSLGGVYAYFEKVVFQASMLTPQQFVETYRGRKKTIYQNAVNSLLRKPVARKDSYLSSFAKCEKYYFTSKVDPVPRIIQPRNPRYNVEVGRYIKPVEKKIYHSLDNMFESPTIFKGYNASQRGVLMAQKWNRFNKPVAIGLDAKRFDQHCSKVALEWEHSIYKLFYRHDKFFSMLLNWQTHNRGFCRLDEGTIEYTVDGNRASGDMNTSLGNCLLMASMVYAYKEHIKVDIELANDGDDCVVILESCNLEKFIKGVDSYFLALGFKMEVEEPVYFLEHIEFCQAHPVFDGDAYVMVRNPHTALAKDCVAIKPLDNPKIFKMWCSAVGNGGLSLTGGIPIWQSFYQKLFFTADGAKPLQDNTMETGFFRLAQGMSRQVSIPSPQARFSFFLAFGITPDVQIAIEEYYDNMSLHFGDDSLKQRYVVLPLGPLVGH
jgi:hypothetical protein